MNVSLRAAAVLGMNALHECIVPKGAETQISDAMRALRSAIDADLSATQPEGFQARYRIPGGEWSSWGHVVCGVKGHEQELRVAPGASRAAARAAVDAEGWISVETRLPEKDEPVLVFNPNGAMPIMIDEWCTYREAPVGWSSATIETGDGWAQHEFEQITHWRAIPAAPGPASPTPAATELELLQVECAGHESAAFYLGMLVDELRLLLSRAMATMKTLHEAAQPDESGPDIDAIIPGGDFRRFVDAHAQLLHDVAQLPEAPTPTPAAGSAVATSAELLDIARSIEGLKLECGMDPESPRAIQNGRYMSIAYRLRALAAASPAPHVGDVGGEVERRTSNTYGAHPDDDVWAGDDMMGSSS